jgi:hypothetical protein
MVTGDQDIGKALVVAQDHIEARFQLLDEVAFKKQRLCLRRRHHEFHAGGERDHQRDAVVMALASRVVRDAVFEVPRLSHVNDVALAVIHAVDAGFSRQPRDIVANDVGAGLGG